jgi:hypothetical protein
MASSPRKSSRRLRGAALVAPVVGCRPACFVSPDDQLEAILSTKYLDWFKGFRSRRVTDGIAQFFHSIINPQLNRIKCEVRKPALGASHCEIGVALHLTPKEREVFAALRAGKEKALRLHLQALGFSSYGASAESFSLFA